MKVYSSQLESQVIAVLVQNLERLDEKQKEEADGVHNSLGENFYLFSMSLSYYFSSEQLWILTKD